MLNSKKQTSLLSYWTARYLIVLCIGLVLVGFISSFWLRENEINHRLKLTELVAQELADRLILIQDERELSGFVKRILESRLGSIDEIDKANVTILNSSGRIVYSSGTLVTRVALIRNLETAQQDAIRIQLRNGKSGYLISRKIESDEGTTLGWVSIIQPTENLVRKNQEYGLLFILLGALAIFGWGTIYFLTKRLSGPIQQVSEAALQIREGNYDVQLPQNLHEKELASLVDSFQQMSNKLHKLEGMRTELLAGVTHELKTPVTSISSLLQAIKDQVVTEEQAKEFIAISLKETEHLNLMIADLLDFNAFATGAVKVNPRMLDLNRFLKEVVHQWQLVKQPENIEAHVNLPQEDIHVNTDPTRLQQILMNVLNNAAQAIQVANQSHPGRIVLSLERKENGVVRIEMTDNGPGIPPEEQAFVFERFFRGSQKKLQVRGLGLGLPYSRMVARALGGDLLLVSSSSAGTTFVLEL